MTDRLLTEPWIDKRALAEHLACSLRSVEYAIADGMPHVIIFGRVKFRVSEVEAWLEETGRLTRRGDDGYAERPPMNADAPPPGG